MQQIYVRPANIIQPLFNHNLFKRKPIELLDKPTRWRKQADLVGLSPPGRLKLEWMIFYETAGKKDAYRTAIHFGITAKTFYKWHKRFDGGKVSHLEEQSRRPYRLRNWEVSLVEEARIKKLRSKHLHWGKKKLKRRYQRIYNEEISTWKIERVIRKHDLYPDKIKAQKTAAKLKKAREKPKLRINDLTIESSLWFLIHLDTIVLYIGNLKRYILTACDHTGKFGYARMYTTKSSRAAKDFLYRLHYLIDNTPDKPINAQTDEGSEFKGEFDRALQELEMLHWFSRVKTPQDNSVAERFNQTLEYEWLYDGHIMIDVSRFNKELAKWLEEYNFIRPHETLDYLTPMEYIENRLEQTNKNLLPMYSARTIACVSTEDMLCWPWEC